MLIVDDEPNVVNALKRVFARETYRILTAGNGRDALELLRTETVHVVLSDYMMPVMNGAEFLKQARAEHPETMRIMLTGHADVNAVMGAIKEGAVYKFILKPWHDDDLRVTIGLAIEQYELQQSNKALAAQNAAKAREINQLSRLAVTNRSQMAIILHQRGLLNAQQLQELYKLQLTRKEPAIKLLLESGWVDEKRLRQVLRKELVVEEVQLPEFAVDPAVAALLPRSLCEKQWIVPLQQNRKKLMLAMADPLDQGLIDNVRFHTELEIQPVMADCAAIQAKIAAVYGGAGVVSFDGLETLTAAADPTEGVEIVLEGDDDASLEELLKGTEEPSAVRLVNAVILEAIRLRASDIHIQPRLKHVAVRYRIDGILVDKIHIPHAFHLPLVSRIKIMAELDIAERRKPQDGRVTVKSPMKVMDLRVSTLPTITGEKVVLRLLDRQATIHELTGIGLSAANLAKVQLAVAKPQGIILATGPTGSGKTTTLYSLLQHDASPEKNYITIEDPVEYHLDMAGQVAVKEKAGLGFAKALRSILRQDPDVILLGEIRDAETAEIAFQAALTGHQVFSTLHTRSTIATIARLFDLGLEAHAVASALEAVIAQRLVRRICDDCREPAPVDAGLAAKVRGLFGSDGVAVARGKGCAGCHWSGYKGRVGIHEVLLLDDDVRHLIATGDSFRNIAQTAAARGMSTLLDDARDKIRSGMTSVDEVLRVLGPQ
jgi:type II secretory ATPase GspE/PulE/Tfp pilus assembly ATPase PilB-like protein/FixJ family two-component response regulator